MKFVHPLVEICIPLHFGVMFAAAGLGCAIKLCKYWGGGVPDMPPIADFLANAVFLFHFVEHRYSLSVLIDGNIAYISEVMSAEMCTY